MSSIIHQVTHLCDLIVPRAVRTQVAKVTSSNTNDHIDSNSAEPDGNASRSPSVEVISASHARPTSKRALEEDEAAHEARGGKKARASNMPASQDEERLAPSYGPQTEATPITFFRQMEGHSASRRRIDVEQGMVRGRNNYPGAHTPMNSLGKNRGQGPGQRGGLLSRGRPSQGMTGLELERSMGSNAMRTSGMHTPPTKRQKTNDAQASTTATQHMINSGTGDVGTAVGHAGQQPLRNEYFMSSELREADKRANQGVHHGPAKKKRTYQNGKATSSSVSSRVQTPAEVSVDQTQKIQGTRSQPVDIDEDETATASHPTIDLRSSDHKDRGKLAPKIDLDRGMSDVQVRSTRRPTEQPIEYNRATEDPVGRFHSKAGRSDVRATGRPPKQRTAFYDTLDQPDLRQKFKRTTNIEASQRTSPIDENVDELAGGNTIQRTPQASRSQSDAMTQRTIASRRSQSPTSLRRTEFTHGSTKRPSSRDLKVPRNPDDNEAICIPIRSLYCKACVLEQCKASLVWDQSTTAFRVYSGSELQKIPGCEKPIFIGKAAVTAHFARDPYQPRAVLKGSKNEVGNGYILIEFFDSTARDQCEDELRAAANDDMKAKDEEKLQNIWERQVEDAKEAFQRFRSQKHSSPYFRDNTTQDDDQIKYEDDDSMPIRFRLASRPLAQERKQVLPETSTEKIENASSESSRQQPRLLSSSLAATGRRRSTRQSSALEKRRSPSPPVIEDKWTVLNMPEPWPRPVVYPPQPGPRRITVSFEDLSRLDEGEFLNDSVLDFALRDIEEGMAAHYKKDVHFFNTYLYTALTTKDGKKRFNYDAVKRWTNKIDLFSYPYVVVPINLDLHWFVAIICNLPDLQRKVSIGDEEDGEGCAEDGGVSTKFESQKTPDDEDIPKSSPYPTQRLSELSISDMDGSPVHQELNSAAASAQGLENERTATKRHRKKPGPPLRKYNTFGPTIMTLDSFGQARSTEIKYLKEYLRAEADEKRGMALDVKAIQGLTAKGIPEQPNFCDCGIYVVGYVQEFAKDPRKFVEKVLSREMRRTDFDGFNPSESRADLRNKLLDLQNTQEAAHKTQKKEKAAKKRAAELHPGVSPSKDQSPQASTANFGPNVVAAPQEYLATGSPTAVDEVTTPDNVTPTSRGTVQDQELEAAVEQKYRSSKAAGRSSFRVQDEGDQHDEIDVSPPRGLGESNSHAGYLASEVDIDSQGDEMLDTCEPVQQKTGANPAAQLVAVRRSITEQH